MNKVILAGNLGQDPELKTIESGKKVVNFSLATSEGRDRVEWHKIVGWEKTAELCAQYLKKGSKVLIEGRNQTRSYEKDGDKRYVTEVVATRVEFLGSKSDDTRSVLVAAQGLTESPIPTVNEDESLPF